MLYWRITAVALTLLFAATLVWLYGFRTSLVWAAGMAAFLLILWAATIPMRRRTRRVLREMGLGPDGRPLAEEEDEEPDDSESGDPRLGDGSTPRSRRTAHRRRHV